MGSVLANSKCERESSSDTCMVVRSFHKYPRFSTVGRMKICFFQHKYYWNPQTDFWKKFFLLSFSLLFKLNVHFFFFLFAPGTWRFVLLSQMQAGFSGVALQGCAWGQRLNWIPVSNLVRPKGTRWHGNRVFIRLSSPKSWALPSPRSPKLFSAVLKSGSWCSLSPDTEWKLHRLRCLPGGQWQQRWLLLPENKWSLTSGRS